MTWKEPPQGPNDVVISRVFLQADMDAKLRFGRAAVWRGVLVGFVIYAACAVLLRFVIDDDTFWTGVVVVIGVTLLIGCGVGVPVGRVLGKRVLVGQMGVSQVLTAHWSDGGLWLGTDTVATAVPWATMRSLEHRGELWAVHTRWASGSPNAKRVITLPGDFVTPAVIDKARAAGVNVR